MRSNALTVLALLSLSAPFAACASASGTFDSPAPSGSATPAKAAAAAAPGKDSPELVSWRKQMAKKPSAKPGCYVATHPSTEWEETPCAAPSGAPQAFPRPASMKAVTAPSPGPSAIGRVAETTKTNGATGAAPFTAGGSGGDESAVISGTTISQAIGSFPEVTGVTSTSDYSLQLNTNQFPITPQLAASWIPACSGKSCQGWEQFLYASPSPGAPKAVFIQNWIFGYGSGCPGGWTNGGNGCWINSATTGAPAEALANIGSMTITGIAGANDEVMLSIAGSATVYKSSQTSAFGLYTAWNDAEFNVVGDGNLSGTSFNSGSTVVVQVEPETVSGTRAPPSCGGGSTGETNSLTIIPNSCCAFGGDSPGIQFFETNATGVTPPECPTLVPYANPLNVPQGDFTTSTLTMNGGLIGTTPNVALLPDSCTASTPEGTVANLSVPDGVPTFKFGAPLSAAVGSTYNVTIQCETGSTVQKIVVTAPNPANTAALSAGNDPLEVPYGGTGMANLVLMGPWQSADNGAGATVVVTSNPIPYATYTFTSGGPIDGWGIISMSVTATTATPPGMYTVGLLITDKASGTELPTTAQVEVLACQTNPSSEVCVAAANGSAACGDHAAGCGASLDCGTCAGGATCGADGYCPCVPTVTSCSSTQTCGSIVNNCGQTIECGTCSGSTTCSNGTCCASGDTGGNGVCCPAGEAPSGTHCCPTGETWSGTECGTVTKGGGGSSGGGCRCTKTECTCE